MEDWDMFIRLLDADIPYAAVERPALLSRVPTTATPASRASGAPSWLGCCSPGMAIA